MTARKAFVSLALLIAAGCSSVTPADSQAVRVTNNPQATAGCKYLGQVTGPVFATHWDTDDHLRDQAAKLGANLLFRERHGSRRGEAYKCEERP